MVAINPSSRPSCPEKNQGFDLDNGRYRFLVIGFSSNSPSPHVT